MLMTPWVQRLLLANVVVFVFSRAFPAMIADFGLIPLAIPYRPWTLVTYMFLHGGFTHILFNMLMLFFFGPRLEERLGSRTFIWFYLACGVGGAVLSFATPYSTIVGASGAIFGVVVGFARYWPREEIYIWGVLPIQARVLAIFMVVSSLVAGFAGAASRTAHFAHLGGLVVGWIFLRIWERRRQRRVVKRPAPPRKVSIVVDLEALERWKAIPRERLHEINGEEVDKLLRKAHQSGAGSLTTNERAFLDRMSESG